MLKVQELEDYLRNVRGNEQTVHGVTNSPKEQQIQSGYQVQAFLKSPEVAQLIAQLRRTTGGEGFDLEKYATSLQDNLKQLQQDAVILYPFVLDERLELVLVTPYAPPIRRTVAVKREELNRTIVEFRDALKSPTTDAKTPAQKLYNWLIKPLENDLTQALMDTFYAALENGNMTKAEALRLVQITLITGYYKALGQQRGLEIQQRISSSLPPTVMDRLSHPYYWAPFILIGNGL